MIASVGPSSAEGSLLKGTSDEPSSGPLPLTLEKRLKILQKWQTQQTLYTDETREFILKSGFSRDQPEKVPSVSRSSTEGSLLKGTSDDPSSGPLPLTLEKRLEILQKWQNQQTLYTEEIREFILKSGFSRDKQKKDYPSCPSDVEETDSALVQQQDTDSALVQHQDTDSALVQQLGNLLKETSDESSWTLLAFFRLKREPIKKNLSKLITEFRNAVAAADDDDYNDEPCFLHERGPWQLDPEGNPLKETSDEPSWALLTFIRLKREPIKKNLSKLITEFRNAVDAADDDDYNDEPCFLHERGPWQLDPEDDSDDVNLIKSKRSADDKASDAVEITKFGTVPADTILRQMLIQSRRFSEEYGLRFLYESDFTELELENVYRHVFQISHRNKVLGTAFLFNLFPEGQQYLLTAGHVIAGYDEETELETEGWLCLPANPVGISSIKDVGVLRFKRPLFPRMYPFLRPLSIDLGTETSTHIYVVGCMSGALSEKCPVLPSQDKDDGFIRFQSKLFSEDSFGSPCLVFKDGQYVVKGMLIGREGGTDTPYELIAITFRCVWKRLGFP